MVVTRIVKPKNAKSKRYLAEHDPKVHENDKNAMFIKGGRTSETVSSVLKDLYMLKKPNAVSYQKKNITRPFEDTTMLEFFSKKSDASLFAFGSHSKKRPNNLVLGRMFDHQVLDMIELGITRYKALLSEGQKSMIPVGTKPCLVFNGELFDTDPEFQRLKSLLIDFFRGPTVSSIRLAGLEHALHFTAVDGKLLLRSYRVLMMKSGSRIPRVELEVLGPSIDFEVKRTKLASRDLFRTACRKPKNIKPKKKKNISHDAFGSKLGRIHMSKQDLGKLQTRKMKGLKRGGGAAIAAAENGDAAAEGAAPPAKQARVANDESDMET